MSDSKPTQGTNDPAVLRRIIKMINLRQYLAFNAALAGAASASIIFIMIFTEKEGDEGWSWRIAVVVLIIVDAVAIRRVKRELGPDIQLLHLLYDSKEDGEDDGEQGQLDLEERGRQADESGGG